MLFSRNRCASSNEDSEYQFDRECNGLGTLLMDEPFAALDGLTRRKLFIFRNRNELLIDKVFRRPGHRDPDRSAGGNRDISYHRKHHGSTMGHAPLMSTITGYHAHVYFDADTRERAQQLCEAAGREFLVSVGRMHDKPVGPHPRGSCQLAFGSALFGQVLPWLIANRNGLTIFAHAETGDSLKDHTDHVVWLGPSETLNLARLGSG